MSSHIYRNRNFLCDYCFVLFTSVLVCSYANIAKPKNAIHLAYMVVHWIPDQLASMRFIVFAFVSADDDATFNTTYTEHWLQYLERISWLGTPMDVALRSWNRFFYSSFVSFALRPAYYIYQRYLLNCVQDCRGARISQTKGDHLNVPVCPVCT